MGISRENHLEREDTGSEREGCSQTKGGAWERREREDGRWDMAQNKKLEGKGAFCRTFKDAGLKMRDEC